MVRFYNPKDEAELARVEAILRKGGIEYFLSEAPAGTAREIKVAEEDIPKAEELMRENKNG